MSNRPPAHVYAVYETRTGVLLCFGTAEYCAQQLGIIRNSFVQLANRQGTDRASKAISVVKYPGVVYTVKLNGETIGRVPTLTEVAEMMHLSPQGAVHVLTRGTLTRSGYSVTKNTPENRAHPHCLEKYLKQKKLSRHLAKRN